MPNDEMPNELETLLEKARADLHAALRDVGHPIWAAESLVSKIDAYIAAKFAALSQEIRNVIP